MESGALASRAKLIVEKRRTEPPEADCEAEQLAPKLLQVELVAPNELFEVAKRVEGNALHLR